ncbi:MAG: hypothetical protein JOY54_08650 [Acidobacteriaceae bacterium]|nr:hypothetical protein [Acidobacteriaceae bacterium]
MKPVRLLYCFCSLGLLLGAAELPTAAEVSAALRQISLDPGQTYHVRELTLSRGDIRIYLTEGLLSFATPVNSRCVAAVFVTQGVEAGDGEALLLPDRASERASLASFTKTPNIDEHFGAALFLFSDDTAKELLSQIQRGTVHPAPEAAPDLASVADPLIRASVQKFDVRMVASLLDAHPPADGVFYAFIVGGQLGPFELGYDPAEFEPIAAGRTLRADNGPTFQLWTSFRPRRAPAYIPPTPRIRDYHIKATIRPDLTMALTARFMIEAGPADGRVIRLDLSHRLKVTSASLDGSSAEVFQHDWPASSNRVKSEFLVISPAALAPETEHAVEVHYEGTVIRQTGGGQYFVDERNEWYPSVYPTRADFDLTFHCPKNLDLVATGDLLSEDVSGDVRTVRRRTRTPVALAGFNLGHYETASVQQGPYKVECYAEKGTVFGPQLLSKAARILDFFSRLWMPLPLRTLSVTPIPGYFGQGFPGLIYLSDISYMRPEDRPEEFRSVRENMFFSDLLLPHEIAHQWWGNIVRQADYRSSWLSEAMANYSALEFLEHEKGSAIGRELLLSFRDNLSRQENGKTAESAGPIDFGQRLLDSAGLPAWHSITYEKGAWILQMLRERMGQEGFRQMQLKLLSDYATRPITNDQFRAVAAQFVPPDQPDRSLTGFFDTWVYGTGIPVLKLRRAGTRLSLEVTGVEDEFTADIPLSCTSGKRAVRWVRAVSGSNTIDPPSRPERCELPAPTSFLYLPAM